MINSKYFVSYLDERNNRSIEQIIEMDNDSLRYSIKKFCKKFDLPIVFFYFYEKNNEIRTKEYEIIFKEKNIYNFINFILFLKKCKILYINIQGFKEFLIALLSKIINPSIKTVHHFHGTFRIFKTNNILKKVFYKFYLNIVDIIVTDTEFEVKKINTFIGKNKAHRFKYGANQTLVKPKYHKKLTLVYVGRVSNEKGIEQIINGIEKIKNKVKLIIVGHIENVEYYNYLKEKLSGFDYEFTGFLSKDEIQRIYSVSDIFINMCPVESFGRVFVEALASGLPVIGNRLSPGPREIIQNKINGWLVEKPKEIENILVNVDNKKINKMRLDCIKSAKKYSYEESYKTLVSILDKIKN